MGRFIDGTPMRVTHIFRMAEAAHLDDRRCITHIVNVTRTRRVRQA
jgi:hypothetical protein